MAKEYGKKNSTYRRGSVSKQLLVMLVSFLFGYLSASVFDFTSLSNWVNTRLLAQNQDLVKAKSTLQQAELPKPKFEFYTLLTTEHKETGEQTASVNAQPTPAAPVTAPAPVKVAATPKTTPASAPVANEIAKQMPTSAKQQPAQVAGKEASYLVQVAAFRSRQEAERMKGVLVLKGFVVSITTVSQQNVGWFRVNLGPYPSKALAQKAQIAIARSEHIVGMLRKMDA